MGGVLSPALAHWAMIDAPRFGGFFNDRVDVVDRVDFIIAVNPVNTVNNVKKLFL